MTSYRPQLHFSSPQGWINDPNGLVYHQGLWHLFYQYFPDGLTHGPMHWGHAASSDLVNWQQFPVALAPDELGNIWSGSAIETEAGLLACFTHQNEQRQAQSYALSTDGGRTFTKDPANPILGSENPNFRDPKLFRYEGQWRMLLAAGANAQLFGSPNLRNWQLLSEIAPPQDDWVWECPDLFELDGSWVLIGSLIIPEHPSESYYWLGDFDGATYTPTSGPHRLSFGPDDYAAISWNDAPQGRRVLIGWMSRWDYAAQLPTEAEGFRGAMTLPREVSLHNGQLFQNPPRELAAYRRSSQSLQSWQAGQTLVLTGAAFEIEAEIQLGDANECGFILHTGEDEATIIGYDAQSQEVFIDRTRSGQVDFAPHFAGRFASSLAVSNGFLTLHIVVDACSVELFANEGQSYGASLIFLTSSQRRLELFGQGAQIVTGQVFELCAEPEASARASEKLVN